jgi:hypothetical protein
MYEKPKICHDRILPKDLFKPQATRRRNGAARAIIEFRKLWINGSTLRVRFMGGTPAQQAKAREQALWWTQHANLRFEFGNAPDAEIRVSFDENDGAWSYVGTDCRQIPFDEATMNLGFLDGGTAAHEFGHAIGLAHEHQNPSGGIEWNEEVVLRDLAGPPNNWTPDQIRHNVLEKYKADQIRGTEFDPASIMLYFFPDSWVKNGQGTKDNDVLSDLDKAFIASRDAYPPTLKDIVDLKVDAATATRAAIGKEGEEDVFRFEVRSPGRHIIRTGGSTDVMLKLFGPGEVTRLIAEDDDSGYGLNAQVVTSLLQGIYFAQVRHFSKRGTGQYTVRVKRG